MPMSMHYSCYIFVIDFSFLAKIHRELFQKPKHFYTSTILDHLLPPGGFDIFYLNLKFL
jgi:hypothetical protein